MNNDFCYKIYKIWKRWAARASRQCHPHSLTLKNLDIFHSGTSERHWTYTFRTLLVREYTTLTWPQKDERLFLLRKKLRKTLPTWSFPFPKEELNEFIVVEATSNWWACGITDDKSWLYKELRCNQFSCLFNYSESRSLILVHIDLIIFVFVLHLRASGPHGIFIQILIISEITFISRKSVAMFQLKSFKFL